MVYNGAQIEIRNKNGVIPLFLAAYNGQIEVVKFLIKNHADVNACCNEGQSCLLAAVCGGHTDVVCALVSADVNLQRDDGAFPLIVASHKGHIDIVKLLVDNGAEIEARDNEGITPLCCWS